MRWVAVLLSLAVSMADAWGITYFLSGPDYSSQQMRNFSSCDVGNCAVYTTAMGVTGTLTTSGPMPANATKQNVNALITDYSFTDGVQTFARSDPNTRAAFAFYAWTDANGQITLFQQEFQHWQSATTPHQGGDRMDFLQITGDLNAIHASHNFLCSNIATRLPAGEVCTGTMPDAAYSTAGTGNGVWLTVGPSGTLSYEFYNTTLKHYFRTSEAAEARAIDAGAAGPGWVRTGLDFPAFVAGSGPGSDVCRFYNPVANTHFFTADPAECEQVKAPDSGWRYEGLAFRIQLPVAGQCPAGSLPVYRAYNNRFQFNDSNHRFTVRRGAYDELVAQGWADEGVVMCAAGS